MNLRDSFSSCFLVFILICLPFTFSPAYAQSESDLPKIDELIQNLSELELQKNIENRITTLQDYEELEFFGQKYFEIQDATQTQQYTKSEMIPSNYTLGAGDEIIVQVRGMNNNDFRSTISPHGTISFEENIDSIFVLGKTLSQAEEHIQNIYNNYYKNTSIGVELARFRNFTVSIVGEVNQPGSYLVTGLNRLLDLLSLCGGITEKGSLRNIKLKRVHYSNPEIDDSTEVVKNIEDIKIDLYDILLEGNEEENIRVQSGDRIIVPPVAKTVSVYGEVKRPAKYEFNDTLTMQEVVDLCGGFTSHAFLSRIQIKRIDESGFLQTIECDLTNESNQSFEIKDGDIIHVYSNLEVLRGFVTISGNVWYPGDYSLSRNMKLSDLIDKAGGCLPGTYLDKVDILRFISPKEREIINVSLEDNILPNQENDIELKEWDIVHIYQKSEAELPRIVTIEGEIEHPGFYPLRKNMNVYDLILTAGGLTNQANTRSAEILRLDEKDQTYNMEINLRDIYNNPNSSKNIPLQRDDKVRILKRENMYALHEATIEGEVENPGSYEIAQGENVSDLITKAGGLTNNAYKLTAELTRYHATEDPEIIEVNIAEIIEDPSSDKNYPLENMDHIRIFKDPAKLKTITVRITGQVHLPGTYTLKKDANLSELIEKSGGIREEGYKKGLVLTRADLLQKEQNMVDNLRDAQEKELLRLQSSLVESAITEDEKELQLKILEMRQRISSLIDNRLTDGRLVFEPDEEDPPLVDGDTIHIPMKPNSVLIVGAVYHSGSRIYRDEYDLADYLDQVGGMAPYADKDQTYIIKTTGYIKKAQFKNSTSIHPGDTIVVPPKFEVYNLSKSLRE